MSDDLNDAVSSQSLHAPPLPALPFDILPEILCRLPVKLLLQLRCLCKSFNSLISDPKFAKKHLLLSTKRHHIIVSSTNNLKELLLFDSLISNVFEASNVVTQTQLNYPNFLKNGNIKPWRVCSSDGILCFSSLELSAILWNPSIRKFKILPPLKTSPKRNPFCLYSFGYHHLIHNYKFVALSLCVNMRNEVSVHTLGTDYWRRIDDDFPGTIVSEPGIFVSGTVNWLTIDDSKASTIVSLDLEKESYQKLSIPDLEKGRRTLGLLRDCLCIFAKNDMFLDVWIMKEFGNKES